MTKGHKVDPAVLEREYVFDASPRPISLTDLAEKYGLARSGVADKAMSGNWTQKRREFRETLGMKVVEAFTDKWAQFEIATREKMLHAMVKTLDVYTERLDAGEIKPTTKDAVSVAAALRVLMGDHAAITSAEARVIDPGSVDIPRDALAEFINRTKRDLLTDGRADDDDAPRSEARVDGELAPTGTEGTR